MIFLSTIICRSQQKKLRRLRPLTSATLDDHVATAAKSKAQPQDTVKRALFEDEENVLSQETLVLGETSPGAFENDEGIENDKGKDGTSLTSTPTVEMGKLNGVEENGKDGASLTSTPTVETDKVKSKQKEKENGKEEEKGKEKEQANEKKNDKGEKKNKVDGTSLTSTTVEGKRKDGTSLTSTCTMEMGKLKGVEEKGKDGTSLTSTSTTVEGKHKDGTSLTSTTVEGKRKDGTSLTSTPTVEMGKLNGVEENGKDGTSLTSTPTVETDKVKSKQKEKENGKEKEKGKEKEQENEKKKDKEEKKNKVGTSLTSTSTERVKDTNGPPLTPTPPVVKDGTPTASVVKNGRKRKNGKEKQHGKANRKNNDKDGKNKGGKKAKKGMRKKQTQEEKRAVHRAACKRWHEKWVKKGILRTSNSQEATQKDQTAKAKKAKKASDLPDNVLLALTLDNMEHIQPQTNDLRTTKATFVNAFVAALTEKETKLIAEDPSVAMLTKAEKYKKGVHAWMNSALRGALMSGKNQGYASVPASVLAG